ncbi:hypothetical protein [Hyphomonas atlantica corrig.]|uniref:hypothetical protein n=1 Tax=Hyphomonas atlantica TaxID=1280948 RepID=UPI00235725B4|nr:hypothetical protein [Hyphomonas atlantica]
MAKDSKPPSSEEQIRPLPAGDNWFLISDISSDLDPTRAFPVWRFHNADLNDVKVVHVEFSDGPDGNVTPTSIEEPTFGGLMQHFVYMTADEHVGFTEREIGSLDSLRERAKTLLSRLTSHQSTYSTRFDDKQAAANSEALGIASLMLPQDGQFEMSDKEAEAVIATQVQQISLKLNSTINRLEKTIQKIESK